MWGQPLQVNQSICLHSPVTHVQLFCGGAPWAIISHSSHHLDAVIICQSVSLTPTGPGDMGGQIEWLTVYMCVCVSVKQTLLCVKIRFSGWNEASKKLTSHKLCVCVCMYLPFVIILGPFLVKTPTLLEPIVLLGPKVGPYMVERHFWSKGYI